MKIASKILTGTFGLILLSAICNQVIGASKTFTWTVDSAKDYAFQAAPASQNISSLPAEDPYHLGLNKTTVLQSHPAATVFKYGSGYVIEYPDNTLLDYNYHGALKHVTFRESQGFPKRAYTYSYPFGQLERVSLLIGPKEVYEFQANGQYLIMHCIQHKCYNAEGVVKDKPLDTY